MKQVKNMIAASVLLLMTQVAYGKGTFEGAERPGYGIITADLRNNIIIKYDADGQPEWEYKMHAVDAWAMPDGSVLAAYLPSPLTEEKGGVRLIGPEKETRFDWSVADEIMAVQPLDNGNLLMAECHKGRVTELSLKGERIHSFQIKTPPNGHKTMRRVRLTAKGTVIVNECYSDKLREYDRSGHLLRELDMTRPTGSYPQANGHLLVSSWNAGTTRLIELDPNWTTVWTCTPADLPADMSVTYFGEATRLPNGKILTGASCTPSWVTTLSPGPMLFEVTPDKKVVWKMMDLRGESFVVSVKPIPSWVPAN